MRVLKAGWLSLNADFKAFESQIGEWVAEGNLINRQIDGLSETYEWAIREEIALRQSHALDEIGTGELRFRLSRLAALSEELNGEGLIIQTATKHCESRFDYFADRAKRLQMRIHALHLALEECGRGPPWARRVVREIRRAFEKVAAAAAAAAAASRQ
eukprot:tig00000055_g20103.t1